MQLPFPLTRSASFCPLAHVPRRAAALAALFLSAGAPLWAQAPPGPNGTGSLSPAPSALSGEPAASGLTAEEIEELGEAAPVVRDLRSKTPKTVVMLFDVTGSMRTRNGDATTLRRARNAAARIVRRALRPGDDVSLYTFGTGYQVFKKKIESSEDREAVADKVPSEVGSDYGTNIRRPHRDALKQIETTLQSAPNRTAAIVILTDSYNDQPKEGSADYPDYVRYYVPGQLTKYPNTPENRDYERLLASLVQTGKVKQYGIGVSIAPSGRPVERLPQVAATPAPAPVAEETPAPTTRPATNAAPSPLLYVLGGLGLLVLGGAAYYFFGASKPVEIRITGGAGGAKNFQVRGGQPVRLGGDGAQFASDAYAVPGVKETVALIRAGRGGLTLSPPAAAPTAKAGAGAGASAGTSGNQTARPRVFHNGILLEADTPLGIGDEIRVSVPAGEAGGLPKDVRLKISDPRQSY